MPTAATPAPDGLTQRRDDPELMPPPPADLADEPPYDPDEEYDAQAGVQAGHRRTLVIFILTMGAWGAMPAIRDWVRADGILLPALGWLTVAVAMAGAFYLAYRLHDRHERRMVWEAARDLRRRKRTGLPGAEPAAPTPPPDIHHGEADYLAGACEPGDPIPELND